MVERNDFFVPGRGMQQHESGLVSEDVWLDMVDACRHEAKLDYLAKRTGEVQLSRGRHHKPAEASQ
jgi:hypothetical protein